MSLTINDLSCVRPLHGHVLVRFTPIPGNVVLSSGLVVPYEMVGTKIWRIATVIAIGEGVPKGDKIVPHEIKVGDKVLLDRIFGAVVFEGKMINLEYRVVSYDQITGVFESEIDNDYWISM